MIGNTESSVTFDKGVKQMYLYCVLYEIGRAARFDHIYAVVQRGHWSPFETQQSIFVCVYNSVISMASDSQTSIQLLQPLQSIPLIGST
jgi:hypothetical protein